MPGGGPAQTPMHLLVLTVLLAIAPLILISEYIALWRVDVVDDQMFGYYGWRILHGATLYRDVWDNKPPGIFWMNALGFLISGDRYIGVIILCGLSLVVAHLSFFTICATVYFRGAAVVTTVLACFFITHLYFQGGANRTETFLIACELTAVAAYARGFAHPRKRIFVLAGALCGAAFLFKQVGLAAFGAMGIHLLVLVVMRSLSWRKALQRGLLLLIGCLSVIFAAAAVLAAQGALSEALFATFTFNRFYFEAGASRFPANLVNYILLRDHLFPILTLPVLMAITALIHASLWALRPLLRPRDIEAQLQSVRPVLPYALVLFVVWLLVALYGALMSPHGFRHYLVPVIPPLMLVCGYLVNVLQAEGNLLRRLQHRIWVLGVFVTMGYLALGAFDSQFSEFWKVWVKDRKDIRVNGRMQPAQAAWEEVGDELAAVTKPTDRVQAFGYLPGVYLHARRVNATRYSTTEKIGQVPKSTQYMRDEIRRGLEDRPPEAIVMTASDYHWVTDPQTGQDPLDSLGIWLGRWLPQNYTRVRDITASKQTEPLNVYIFKRNDLVPPEDALPFP